MDPQPVTLTHALAGILLSALLVLPPTWRVFRRAGLPPFWSLVVFLPTVGLLAALFLLAFNRWPADAMPREVE